MQKEPFKQSEDRVSRVDIHEGGIDTHLDRIGKEFRDGFELLKRHPKSVTIFGSSLIQADNPNYKKAEELAGRIARELGYTVFTGGGPGIMEAANKGAIEAPGESVGLTVSLPHEHKLNKYSNDSAHYSYFFTRKTILTFAAETYIFFPGGFGTFDELFSILTLIQTGKIPNVPIFLYDSKFWGPLETFLKDTMCEKYKNIDFADLSIFKITDSLDEIIQGIKTAPISEWWRNIN